MNRLAVVVALLIASVAIALLWGRGERPAPDLTADPTASGIGPGAARPASTGSVDATLLREAVEGSSRPLDSSGSGSAPELRGLVQDPTGSPIAGAQVQVTRVRTDGFALLDRGPLREPIVVADLVSDLRGEFATPLALGVPHRLCVRAPDWCVLWSGPHVAGETLVLRLARGASVHGRVTRLGQGIGRTQVTVRQKVDDGGRRGSVLARTDSMDDGSYRIEGLQPGTVTLEVDPPRGCAPRGTDLTLGPGADATVDLELLAGERILGRVVDDPSGRGIGDAEVGVSFDARYVVRTAPDGSFAFEDFPSTYLQLSARAAGHAASEVLVRDGGLLREAIEIRLAPGRRARGRVVRPDGAPIADAYVAAAGYEIEDHAPQRIEWIGTRSLADGSFTLEDLRGDLDHVLFVHADGFGVYRRDFQPGSRELASLDLGDVLLEPGQCVVGRLVDEVGQGWSLATVELRASILERRAPGQAADPNAVPRFDPIDSYVSRRIATTDQSGRFAIADLASGNYELTSRDALGRPGASLAVRVDRAIPLPVELVRFRGAHITGRVTVEDGHAPPKCYVSVDPNDGATTATDVECAPDGSFEAIGLARGLYTLKFYPYASEADRAARRLFDSMQLTDVPAGREGLVVTLPRKL